MTITSVAEEANLAFDFAARQLHHLVETYPDYLPVHTVGGKWGRERENWIRWCEGFLGGQLWLIYLHAGDPWFRRQAEHYTRLVEGRATDRQTHDLGFIFWPTWKRWYDLAGEENCRQVLIEAGRTLASRFQEKGGYLASHVGEHSLFIDIIMNIALVFYAAEQTGQGTLGDIARQHCLTTQRYLLREDGSIAHEGIFNPSTGEFRDQTTRQGWRDDSTWARGQAWALYGFTTAYAFTGDKRFLETACACADYYIARTPDHGVPPNDWDEPEPAHPYDSSAATIAASGLLDLANLVDETVCSSVYRGYALRILDTLTSPQFLAHETPGWEGVLKHGIYHLPKGVGVGESLAWGDYYFLEALSKAIGSYSQR
jgi:unsaturated chondroitin disaccharide hydrolase